MSAIPLPTTRPTSTATAAPPSPRAHVIAEPSSDAARLPAGTTLKGNVLPGAPKGLVHIQTDVGMLVGRSTVPLSEGTDLTLLLQSRTPRLHLQITAMKGQALQSAHPPSTARATPGDAVTVALGSPKTPSASPSTAATTQPTLTAGSTATATLLQPAPGLSSAPPAGSQMPIRLIAVQTPVAGFPVAAVAPTESAARSPTLTPGQTLSGTVMASTPGAPPVLATPVGTLSLGEISGLPRGSAVTLEIISQPILSSSTAVVAEASSIARLNPANAQWPALESALETVQGVNPTAANYLMDRVLPGFNAGLTSQTLFFLRALGRGNVGQWLGEAPTETLKTANPAVLAQLGEEFRQMGRPASETEPSDWRVFHLPLAFGAKIEPVRLLLRQHGGERRGCGGAAPDTRFVVEVTLSHLGRIQFDGLVREDGRRLDLMVRSDPPLPATLHEDIRTLFTRSSEIAGLKGDVGFQATPPEFVDVKAEPSANPHNGMLA